MPTFPTIDDIRGYACTGNTEKLRILFKEHPELIKLINSRSKIGETPLFLACLGGT